MSRLDEIKARADVATPGPWHAWDRGIGWEVHKGEECAPGCGRSCDALNGEFRDTFTRADAEFIAAAREDVPWLVSEVERLTAERDALAAQVARAEKLAGQWERLADTAINPDSREWLQACAETLRECLSGWQKMHAALDGSTGQECVRVDPDPGHEDEGYSCVTHNCAWDECPANQEDQS